MSDPTDTRTRAEVERDDYRDKLGAAYDREHDALKVIREQVERAEVAEAGIKAMRDVVFAFIDERPGYITAMKNTRGDGDMTDYYRWSGNAEARRQLATALGLKVPHEYADRIGADHATA